MTLHSAVFPGLLAAVFALAAPACQPSEAAPSSARPAPPPVLAQPSADPVALDAAPADTTERPPMPEGFVRLSEVAPEIAQEIRYATAYNFVGEPIDAYEAPECILTEQAATALTSVARDLERQGLGLKVYDCYRPQTAVNHFARWTGLRDQSMKTAFYPEEDKGWLFARGYIATRSGHSRGSTVDLTLVRKPAEDAVRTSFPAPEEAPRCDGDWGERLNEGDLDMGTAYDCFTPLAATDSRGISAEARRNRDRLRSAMSRRGFRNYAKEWWHFTLRDEPHTGTYFDFPVE